MLSAHEHKLLILQLKRISRAQCKLMRLRWDQAHEAVKSSSSWDCQELKLMRLPWAQAHEAFSSLGSWTPNALSLWKLEWSGLYLFVQPFITIDQEQLTLRRYAAYIYSPTMLSAHEHKLVMVQLMKRSWAGMVNVMRLRTWSSWSCHELKLMRLSWA